MEMQSPMIKAARTFGKYLATFVVLIALFNGALYLACSFDSKHLEAQVLSSRDTLLEQDGFPVYFHALNVENDNFGDGYIINEMYSVDPNEPLISALKVRRNYRPGSDQKELQDMVGDGLTAHYYPELGEELLDPEDYNTITELDQYMSGQKLTCLDYGRYWHGYFCYIRPLMVLFDITQIRHLLLATYCVLLAYFLHLLHKRFGRDIAVIFGGALVGGGFLTAWFSLCASGNFLTLIISAIIYTKWLDRIRDFHLYLFVVACVTNFADFLTSPLICLGVLGGLHLLKLRRDGQSWQHCCWQFLLSCGVWLVGYAGTWLAKWMEYDLVIQDRLSMLDLGLGQCLYRLARDDNRNPIYNGKHVFLTIMIISKATLFAVITEAILLYLHKFTVTMRGFNRFALPFLLMAPIPIVWYLVAANHTVVHYFFTYRQSTLFTLGLLLATQEQFYGATVKPTPPPTASPAVPEASP